MQLLIRAGRNADVLIAFDTFSVALPSYLAARWLRLPLVVRVPGDYAWEQGVQRFGIRDSIEVFQHKKYGIQVEALRSVQRFILRHAALVLVPSDFFLKLVGDWGLPHGRTKRVYLGLPMEAEPADIPSIEGNVIFSLGRFVPWKGFPMLIDLLLRFQDWQLVIAGSGPDHKNIEALAREKGVASRVLLPGMISRAQVIGWYKRADAFVLNTSQENFSFQVLEAMREGAAIITTNIGSLPELITDKVEGVLCDPNNIAEFAVALQSIEDQPQIWNMRKSAAQAKAHHFSIQTSAKGTVEAIRNICR
jgi:glycogen(starch) synthase